MNLDDTRCPQCGEQMELRLEEASTIDVPPEPVRVIKFFAVQGCACRCCGKKVRPRRRKSDALRALINYDRSYFGPGRNQGR